MEILFLRHGDALDEGQRPLSNRGQTENSAMAEHIEALDIRPDAIYSSPLLRARQTADIVSGILGVAPQVVDLLNSGARLEQIKQLLAEHRPDDTVMLIGHEPDLSTTIGDLIGGGSVRMKKSGVALVDCHELQKGKGTLQWLLHPAVLAARV